MICPTCDAVCEIPDSLHWRERRLITCSCGTLLVVAANHIQMLRPSYPVDGDLDNIVQCARMTPGHVKMILQELQDAPEVDPETL